MLYNYVSMILLLFLNLVLSVLKAVQGFPNGPPAGMCLAPYPHHNIGGTTILPQSNEMVPYKISLSSNTYGSGTLINITIISNTTKTFKGLLLTFKQNTTEIVLPLGEFISCDSSGFKFHSIQTNTNSCLVHSNANIKNPKVTCLYKPPVDNFGTLKMQAIILQDYKTFWTRLEQFLEYVGTAPLQKIKNPTATSTSAITEVGCGSIKSCLFFPNLCMLSRNCEYMMSYKKTGDNVDFEIVGPNIGYMAMALSFDTKMNDDLVAVCAMDPDTNLPQVQTGITIISSGNKGFVSTVDDNIVQRRTARMSTLIGKSVMACSFSITNYYSANVPYPTNLSQNLNIFLANGGLYPGTPYVSKHQESPLILFTQTILYSDVIMPNKYFNGLDYSKQVHGSLMTVAFIIFLPIAVMIARHFRHNIRVEVCGKQLWFYLHIVCNLLFFVFAFTGYFYMIANVNNHWSVASQIHGAVGTVVMILALINMIMGFTRPDIGTPKRIYFYWAHFLNGSLIRILAFVTFWLVFFTLTLRTGFKNWMMTVVIIWTGVDIIISIIYAILRKVRGSKLAKQGYELDNKLVHNAQTNHVGSWGLVAYIIFIVVIALAMLCGLWLN